MSIENFSGSKTDMSYMNLEGILGKHDSMKMYTLFDPET